jgi:hypothetical protein
MITKDYSFLLEELSFEWFLEEENIGYSYLHHTSLKKDASVACGHLSTWCLMTNGVILQKNTCCWRSSC